MSKKSKKQQQVAGNGRNSTGIFVTFDQIRATALWAFKEVQNQIASANKTPSIIGRVLHEVQVVNQKLDVIADMVDILKNPNATTEAILRTMIDKKSFMFRIDGQEHLVVISAVPVSVINIGLTDTNVNDRSVDNPHGSNHGVKSTASTPGNNGQTQSAPS